MTAQTQLGPGMAGTNGANDPDLAAWVDARQRLALGRMRRLALALALILLAGALWLGFRQARLAGLPAANREALAGQSALQARLRLKELALAAYLAKVRGNCLLMDLTGRFDVAEQCRNQPSLHGLPDSSPCAALWLESLRRIWARALGPDAPPVPDRLRRDPWGSPYLLDQTEAVCGQLGAWCPKDTIGSAGPVGLANGPGVIIEAIPQHLGPSFVHEGG
jgi:hypothetical protein